MASYNKRRDANGEVKNTFDKVVRKDVCQNPTKIEMIKKHSSSGEEVSGRRLTGKNRCLKTSVENDQVSVLSNKLDVSV